MPNDAKLISKNIGDSPNFKRDFATMLSVEAREIESLRPLVGDESAFDVPDSKLDAIAESIGSTPEKIKTFFRISNYLHTNALLKTINRDTAIQEACKFAESVSIDCDDKMNILEFVFAPKPNTVHLAGFVVSL